MLVVARLKARAAGQPSPDHAVLVQELAQAKARIAALEARISEAEQAKVEPRGHQRRKTAKAKPRVRKARRKARS